MDGASSGALVCYHAGHGLLRLGSDHGPQFDAELLHRLFSKVCGLRHSCRCSAAVLSWRHRAPVCPSFIFKRRIRLGHIGICIRKFGAYSITITVSDVWREDTDKVCYSIVGSIYFQVVLLHQENCRVLLERIYLSGTIARIQHDNGE